MAQHHNPRIVTNGLIYHLDPINGGKGGSKIITKPTQIDDCALWLDAADTESVVGSTVTDWLDKSGNGNHLGTVDGDPAYGGNYKINDKQVIYFDGNDSIRKDSTVMSGATAATCFVVYQPTIDATSTSWCVLGTINNDNYWYYTGDNDGYWGVFTNTRISSLPDDTHNYNHQNHTVICTSVAGPLYGIYWNGGADPTVNRYDYSSNAFNVGDRFIVGAGYNTSTSIGRYFKGYVAEVIVYSRALPDVERQQVERYLGRKWAVDLLSSDSGGVEATPSAALSSGGTINLANGAPDSEELADNVDFDLGDTVWSNGGASELTIVDQGGGNYEAVFTAAPFGAQYNQTNAGELQKSNHNLTNSADCYVGTVTFSSYTDGSLKMLLSDGSSNSFSGALSGAGTHSYLFKPPGGTGNYWGVYVTAANSDFRLGRISLRRLNPLGSVWLTHRGTLSFHNAHEPACDIHVKEPMVVADNLPWTIEFWIKRHKRDDTNPDGICGNYNITSTYERLQFDDSATVDKLVLVDIDNNSYSTSITNSTDVDCLHKWRHVVLAFDGTTDATTAGCVRQYTDGQDQGPAIALPHANSGIKFRAIGSQGQYTAAAGYRMEGEMGSFRVYDKQLSHAEVLQNYNAQRAKYQNKKMSFAAPGNLKLYLDAQSGTSSNYYADGTWYDISGGTANNATRANATFTDAGVKYYDFDGTGDYFTVADDSSLDFGTGDFSLNMWVYLESNTDAGVRWLLEKGQNDLQIYQVEVGDARGDNKIVLSVGDGTDYARPITSVAVVNQWANIAATFSGITAKIYLNGTLEDTQTMSNSVAKNLSNSEVLEIGRRSSGNYIEGKVAIINMYKDVALSADQIMQNYNYFKHRFGK